MFRWVAVCFARPTTLFSLELIMKAKMSLQKGRFFALAIVAIFSAGQVSLRVHAQKAEKPKTAHPSAPTGPGKSASANKRDAPPNNPEYAARVKQYTTESYFMT